MFFLPEKHRAPHTVAGQAFADLLVGGSAVLLLASALAYWAASAIHWARDGFPLDWSLCDGAAFVRMVSRCAPIVAGDVGSGLNWLWLKIDFGIGTFFIGVALALIARALSRQDARERRPSAASRGLNW